MPHYRFFLPNAANVLILSRMATQPPANIIAAAKNAEEATGIPASIQLAQWALESGWGAHMPPGSNNPFGVKAIGDQPSVVVATHEFIDRRFVAAQAAFAVYPTLADAFTAHARLLADAPAYAHARACLPDVAAFCDALTGVYATDPTYGTKLNAIIAGSRLTQYDALPAPAPAPEPVPVTPAPAPVPTAKSAPPMNPFMKSLLTSKLANNIILGSARTTIAAAIPALEAGGWLKPTDANNFLGAVFFLVALGLSAFDKMIRGDEIKTALNTPVPGDNA